MSEKRDHTELRFERSMSEAEALMWNIEKDPWLNPNAGNVIILDEPIDFKKFRRRMKHAVANVPRLRERVSPGLGRLSPPTWATDAEFDLAHHLRHVSLPGPGSTRQLYDLATKFYDDPYDRTRPLWMFVVIDGLKGGKGALFWKSHHSITDGHGMVRLSERYMELERDATVPPKLDLDQVIAEAVAADERGGGATSSVATVESLVRSVGHIWRREAGRVQRGAGELAIWATDPKYAADSLGESAGAARSAFRQVTNDGDPDSGSPLWANRSRGRRLESLRVPLESVRQAGKALGGSINDVFVTGAVLGAAEYHARRGVTVETFNSSFVVSTRTDKTSGGNAFAPVRVQLPGGPMTVIERFEIVRDRLAEARTDVKGAGALSALAGVANLLPTSMITQMARAQAAKMDFATSNLRAAPFPMYISGAKVLESATMGPVAGTAFNLTTISYNGSLDMGVFIDPAAVEDPADLRDCLSSAYGELIEAALEVANNG